MGGLFVLLYICFTIVCKILSRILAQPYTPRINKEKINKLNPHALGIYAN